MAYQYATYPYMSYTRQSSGLHHLFHLADESLHGPKCYWSRFLLHLLPLTVWVICSGTYMVLL